MASDRLESNIVIKSTFAKPNRSGIKQMIDDVDKLLGKLAMLEGKSYTANVKVAVDDSALKKAGGGKGADKSVTGGGSSARRNIAGTGQGAPGGVGGSGFSAPGIRGGGGFTGQGPATSVTATKVAGARDPYKVVTLTEKTVGLLNQQEKQIEEINKDGEVSVKIEDKKTNLLKQQIELTKKRDAQTKARQVTEAKQYGGRASAQRTKASLMAGGFKEFGSENEFTTYSKLEKVNDDVYRSFVRLNNITGKTTESRQKDHRATRMQVAASEKAAAAAKLESRERKLIGRGFSERPVTTMTNAVTGATDTIKTFHRVSGNAFTGFRVDLERLNTATKTWTRETLTGARAARYLGDSIASAAVKVSLWTVSTAVVFSVVRSFKALLSTGKELEQQTVLLARVGRGIEGSWAHRIKQARELTKGITELTAAIGGDAAKAQEAAVVFIRAGQNKREALESVKAALVASRIAELDVVEAAGMMASAMLQFKLRADDMIPILDTLNNLSNRYKVTTDDLLQSISRGGSVFAEHGGRLSEMAALTAVVAETTARTGTQIGNAFKTIQSRMDRLEVSSKLNAMGISLTNSEGNAKSLNSVLIELNAAMDGLNNAEKKQISLSIAGIRQRNILVAALENSERAVVAEMEALQKSGSAMEELGEQSGTLDAKIARLKGVFGDLANDLQGQTTASMGVFVNLLTAIIRMIDVFDGGILKAGLFAGALLLLGKATIFLGKKLKMTSLHTDIMNTKMVATRYTLYKTGLGFVSLGSVVDAYRIKLMAAIKAQLRMLAIHLRSLGIMAAVGLATMAVVTAVNMSAEAYRSRNEAQRESLSLLEHEISAMNQLNKANLGYANTILDLVTKIRMLKEAEDRGGPDTSKQRKALAKQAQNIAKALAGEDGIDLSASINIDMDAQQTRKLQDDLESRVLDTTDKEIVATEKLLQKTRQLILSKQEASTDVMRDKGAFGIKLSTFLPASFATPGLSQVYDKDKKASGEEFGKMESAGGFFDVYYDTMDQLFYGHKQGSFRQKHIDEAKAERDRLLNEAAALQSDERETVEKLKALQERQKLDAGRKKNIADSQQGLRDFHEDLARETEQRSVSSKTTAIYADNELVILGQQLAVSKQITDQAQAHIDKLREIGGPQDGILEAEEAITKERKEQEKLLLKQLTATAKRKVDFISTAKKNRADQYDFISGETVKRRQAGSDDDPFTKQLELNLVQQQNLVNRMQANAKRLEELEIARIFGYGTTGEAGYNSEQAANEAKAIEIQQAETIAQLQEQQNQRVKNLLVTERQIAEERKKSADEAARALGVLSDEDKIRVLAMADFFAANPDKQFSVTEQLAMSSASNQVGQQFYQNRFDKTLNRGNPVEQRLLNAGFGTNRETEAKAAAAAEERERLGGTNEEIARRNQKEFERLERQKRQHQGKPVGDARFKRGMEGGFTEEGEVNTEFNVAVAHGTFNYEALAAQFEVAVQGIYKEESDRLLNKVGEIIDVRLAIKGNERPSVASWGYGDT